MKPHICFFSPYIYSALVNDGRLMAVGGAEIQQVLIAKLLARDGFQVSILTRDFGQPDKQIVDGLEIYKLPMLGFRGIKGLRWFSPRLSDLWKSLRGMAPDLIYVRCATAYMAPAAIYAKQSGARLIFAGASDHDFSLERSSRVSLRDWVLFRWGLRRATTVLVQNVRQLDDVKKNYDINAKLCPNFYSANNDGSAVYAGPVIWVGALGRGKRPELFLELVRRLPEYQFLMVGGVVDEPGGKEAGEEILRNAQNLPNLKFLGYLPPQEIGSIYDGASVLINTSPTEGFPNTFLQSWIRGIPTVSFVNPEVTPGESGTLPCGTLDQMITILRHLKSEPTAWMQRSEYVRVLFDKYHSEPSALLRYREILLANSTK